MAALALLACVGLAPHITRPTVPHTGGAPAPRFGRPLFRPARARAEPRLSAWLEAAASFTPAQAEQLAGPFFGGSLLPYLAFLYFLNVPQSAAPRGVVVGYGWCLVFVFLTIPAAIAAKLLFGVSLADCDWLHGAAESLLTVTNLLLVLAFRNALASARALEDDGARADVRGARQAGPDAPAAAARTELPRLQSYAPWVLLGTGLSALSLASAAAPALASAGVHAPFLGGALNLHAVSYALGELLSREPENALSVLCWLIHTTSLVEWLVAMGLAWRWAETSGQESFKGLTWGMLPLHSSGITACVYHLFFNAPGVCMLLPTQAALTCVGNTCCAYAAYRIAAAGGWTLSGAFAAVGAGAPGPSSWPESGVRTETSTEVCNDALAAAEAASRHRPRTRVPGPVLFGFEDIGGALAAEGQLGFMAKLFGGCLAACYVVKYGELLQADFFQSEPLGAALMCIAVPTGLNVLKWAKRSKDPSFDGWF